MNLQTEPSFRLSLLPESSPFSNEFPLPLFLLIMTTLAGGDENFFHHHLPTFAIMFVYSIWGIVCSSCFNLAQHALLSHIFGHSHLFLLSFYKGQNETNSPEIHSSSYWVKPIRDCLPMTDLKSLLFPQANLNNQDNRELFLPWWKATRAFSLKGEKINSWAFMRFGCLPWPLSFLLHGVLAFVYLRHELKTTQYCLPLAGKQAEWSHDMSHDMSHNRKGWFEQRTKEIHCHGMKLREAEPESVL